MDGRRWNELDAASKANLNEFGHAEFHEYKKELRESGESWESAEDILRGFIWDRSSAE